jgi:hypothetical protein
MVALIGDPTFVFRSKIVIAEVCRIIAEEIRVTRRQKHLPRHSRGKLANWQTSSAIILRRNKKLNYEDCKYMLLTSVHKKVPQWK